MYYLIFVAAILMAAGGYWMNHHFPFEMSKSAIMGVSTITMLYLMGSIVGGFYFFNKKVKQLPEIKDEQSRFAVYMKWVKLRLILIGINFVLNVALYYLAHDKSFLYAAGIGAVAMLFCKPNKLTIERELNPITEIED